MTTPRIFESLSSEMFIQHSLETFRYQHQYCEVYRRFCDYLSVDPSKINALRDIPFLPIELFKHERIISSEIAPSKVFTSSGTTGSIVSKHYVGDMQLYELSFQKAFSLFYNDINDYALLALLPSYLERDGSSLIAMVDKLIQGSNNVHSGFYLDQTEALIEKLTYLEHIGQKTILLGVSYALLDLIDVTTFQLKNTLVMETGGMKGRRKELIKEELHNQLKAGFGVATIHSEYGMTELLSQAYSKGKGIYQCPPWMQVLTRDTEDPFSFVEEKTGGINVIDLANRYSCSFIATQDLGKRYDDGTFEVLGRFDSSDIRGCNLMVL